MRLDLKLPDLPRPRLTESLIRRPLADLIKIKTRNEERWGAGGGSRIFENRKEKLRERLKKAESPKKELEKIKATEAGWQLLLLSLYIESNGQDWLPAFDDDNASDVLGSNGATWTASRRRQAVNLFFERFNTIPALSFLATQLRSAFDNRSTSYGTSEVAWKRYRKEIFQTDGHERIVQSAKKNETLQQLMERYAVPTKGDFSIELRQVFLLKTLERCTLGDEPEVLNEIEKDRGKPAVNAIPLGAAALKILIERVEREASGDWKQAEKWRHWLVRLGCDPRIGRQTAEGSKWWGWATEFQLRLAKQGIIGLSLKVFFDFLDGTVTREQWEKRREFLERLLDSGKILDARLALNDQCFLRLQAELRDPWVTAKLSSTTEDTCIIGLQCVDDLYLLEGTHSFALRAFHRKFPVKGFWERTRREFTDSELRVPKSRCSIHRPHVGDWVWYFLRDLWHDLHIEWEL